MSDAMIIRELKELYVYLVNEKRFDQADAVDQAIARIMSIPTAATKIELGTWQRELDDIIGYIAGTNG